MRSDEIRKRLEASALGSGTTEKARAAPTQEEVNMFIRFLKIFSRAENANPAVESQVNRESLNGNGTGDGMAKLFKNKNSRAN